MSYEQRKLIIVVPINRDTLSNKDKIERSLIESDNIDKCHIVVACDERDTRIAEAFAQRILDGADTTASVVVTNANSEYDVGSISAENIFKKRHKQFGEETRRFRGLSKADRISEADYKICIRRFREEERAVRSVLNKAGYFSFQLFYGALEDLMQWSDVDVEDAGFDPRESIVYLMSEDGLQLPRERNFFEKMEFEKMKAVSPFLVSYMLELNEKDSRYQNCPMVIGGICGNLEDMYALFAGISASYTQNWRRELSGNLVGRCGVSEVMSENFFNKKAQSKRVDNIRMNEFYKEDIKRSYVDTFDTDGSEVQNNMMLDRIRASIEKRDRIALDLAEEDERKASHEGSEKRQSRVIRKKDNTSSTSSSSRKVTIRRR